MIAFSLILVAATSSVAAGRTDPSASRDRDREADMFGAESGSPVAPVSTASAAKANSAAAPAGREDNALAPPRDVGEVDRLIGNANDKLAIGGLLYLRFEYDVAVNSMLIRQPIKSPSLVDLFLDVRPTDRLRGFVSGRLNFDPTVPADSGTAATPPSGSDSGAAGAAPASGSINGAFQNQQQLRAQLDQLWLRFDIDRKVFLTLGRQHIKWGASRFWNPTDFLNADRRNPLDVIDERLGVNMLKLHLPLEKLGWNFYGIATYDLSNTPEQLGGALRAEVVLGQTELTFSAAGRTDRTIRFGADASSGVGPFDLRAELAVLHRSTQNFWQGPFSTNPLQFPDSFSRREDYIPQLVLGADISIPYSDQDSVLLGAEYFYNDAGYDDAHLYPFLLYQDLARRQLGQTNFQADFTPFYLGKHYAAFYALLQAPGNWENTTISMSALGNLSDRSFVFRLDYRIKVLSYLRLNAFAQFHAGEQGGELRFRLDVAPAPSIPALASGLVTKAPLAEVGGGLQVDL